MKEEPDRDIALCPVEANPPTFGMILALKYVEKHFEKIYVVVEDKPSLIETKKAVAMLQWCLDRNIKKYNVLSNKANFKDITVLPEELPEHDVIITNCIKIFSNLTSKGYGNIKLIPTVSGYDETFHRTAYIRSCTFENIKNKLLRVGIEK